MTKIFVSYRRDDTKHLTHRVSEQLQLRFGADNVFLDVDNIPLGSDFRNQIRQKLASSDVFVAVIGHRWLEKGSGDIHNEADWVRLEIEIALERKIPVIPLLIDGTEMPIATQLPEALSEFAYKQAFNFNSEDFKNQMPRFVSLLDRLIETDARLTAGIQAEAAKSEAAPTASSLYTNNGCFIVFVLGVLSIVTYLAAVPTANGAGVVLLTLLFLFWLLHPLWLKGRAIRLSKRSSTVSLEDAASSKSTDEASR